MIAVADTGFVIAVANRADRNHARCVPIYRQHQRIYLPQSTLAEVCYLITREGGNTRTAAFLVNLPRTLYQLEALQTEDIQRAAEVLLQYHDARVDFVDASIIAVAERLNIPRVLTLDRRDFLMVRPRHVAHLELLPEPGESF